MRWFQVNNFNMNWMFNPPNLFGMRTPNRNCCQNMAQPSCDCIYENNTAPTDYSPQAEPAQSEEYASSCYCESRRRTQKRRRSRPAFIVSAGSRGQWGQEGSPARRAAPVREGKPAHRESRGLRDHKGPPVPWGQEESQVRVGRQVPLVIRKTAYLRRLLIKS